MSNTLTIYTDGGSRGNPGPSASGFVVYRGDTKIHEAGITLGVTTNNVAEYTAILASLEWVDAHRESLGEFSGINFFMDSLLARQQLSGVFRITKPHLMAISRKIQQLTERLAVPVSFTHVPREKNKEADAMVNRALDNLL